MAGTSLVTLAKRALVTLLLAFARQYQIPALVINRDSADKDILTAFKKVARRIHPDKGGSTSDFQRLNNARDEWEKAKSLLLLFLCFFFFGFFWLRPKPGDAPPKRTQRWANSFCIDAVTQSTPSTP